MPLVSNPNSRTPYKSRKSQLPPIRKRWSALRRFDARSLRAPALGLLSLLLLALPATSQDLPSVPDFRLDTLRVSVGSRLAPSLASVHVLSRSELMSLPVRDVAEALQWMTGVDVQPRSRAQADVSIRGGTFEQVLVLVDGVRMNDPQTGHFHLDLAVPLDRVERIEVLRGPASAAYGADAFGGVIHVVTRDGRSADMAQGTASLEGGSFDTYAFGLDGTVPFGRWRLSGGYSKDGSDGHRDGTDFQIHRGRAGLAGPLGGGVAHLDVALADRAFGAADFYAPFPSYEQTETRTASARWLGAVSNRLSLEPSVSFRQHNDDFVLRRGDPDFYQNLHESRRWTGEILSRVVTSSSSALALGAEWSRETLESTNLGDREHDTRAVFGEFVYQRDALAVQAGLRLDDRDDFGSFTSPTASLRYRLSERVVVRSQAGRSFRAPTWTDRFYTDPSNQGNPDLEPEKGWSVEVGTELSLFQDRGSRLAVTGFRRETESLIDWARPVSTDPEAPEPWRTRNVENATFTGLEVSLRGVSLGRFALHGDVSWIRLQTTEAPGFFSKSSLRPLHRVFTLGASAPLGAGVSVRAIVRDQTRVGGSGGTTLDTRVRWVVEGNEIYVDGRNLTSTDYADVTGLPVAGRSFSLGVRTGIGR